MDFALHIAGKQTTEEADDSKICQNIFPFLQYSQIYIYVCILDLCPYLR